MSHPRRFSPSISWLIAFESVARLQSVTDAAAELALSQGAVSRQIQKLEKQIGTDLFVRTKKRLTLSAAGAAYAIDVREALKLIQSATIQVQSNPEGGTLNLSILPAFGTYWLAPRLPGFLAANPGVTVNLSTRTEPFDFAQERFHAALHFGQDNWPNTDAIRLMEEDVVPVVSADLGASVNLQGPGDLVHLPLLHLETRPDAWDAWFQQQDVVPTRGVGTVFDQFATMAKAVSVGIGAGLLPRYLVEKDLASGTLMVVPNAKPTRIGSYFMVWPKRAAHYPPLRAFRDWIAAQAAGLPEHEPS